MARFANGRLFSGFVVGVALGAGAALILSSRADVAATGIRSLGTPHAGPTPFEPANALLARARTFVDDVRAQLRQAIDEGRATAAETRSELTARFEAAKHAPEKGEKG